MLNPTQDSTGASVVSTRATPSTTLELLDTRQDLGLFAAAVLEHPSKGINAPPVLAVSQTLDFRRICEIIGKVTGRDIVYRQSAKGEMVQNDPHIGAVFEQMYEFFNRYGFARKTEMRGKQQLGVLEETTSFESFVQRHDWKGYSALTE